MSPIKIYLNALVPILIFFNFFFAPLQAIAEYPLQTIREKSITLFSTQTRIYRPIKSLLPKYSSLNWKTAAITGATLAGLTAAYWAFKPKVKQVTKFFDGTEIEDFFNENGNTAQCQEIGSNLLKQLNSIQNQGQNQDQFENDQGKTTTGFYTYFKQKCDKSIGFTEAPVPPTKTTTNLNEYTNRVTAPKNHLYCINKKVYFSFNSKTSGYKKIDYAFTIENSLNSSTHKINCYILKTELEEIQKLDISKKTQKDQSALKYAAKNSTLFLDETTLQSIPKIEISQMADIDLFDFIFNSNLNLIGTDYLKIASAATQLVLTLHSDKRVHLDLKTPNIVLTKTQSKTKYSSKTGVNFQLIDSNLRQFNEKIGNYEPHTYIHPSDISASTPNLLRYDRFSLFIILASLTYKLLEIPIEDNDLKISHFATDIRAFNPNQLDKTALHLHMNINIQNEINRISIKINQLSNSPDKTALQKLFNAMDALYKFDPYDSSSNIQVSNLDSNLLTKDTQLLEQILKILQ